MDRSYVLSDKVTIHVITFVKQRIITAGEKIRRYKEPTVPPEQHIQKSSEPVLQRTWRKDSWPHTGTRAKGIN